MEEIWKDVVNYEGLYQVSNLGNIRFLQKGGKKLLKEKICKPSLDSSGYRQIILTKNKKRKSFKVHRLVAIAFIPNINNLPQINHLDENKQNNNVNNLEWCTILHNSRYGTRPIRCSLHWKKRVKQIQNGIIIKEYDSLKEAEKNTNIKYQQISACCRKINHSAGGYEWKYC